MDSTEPPIARLLTVEEVAGILRCHKATIRDYANEGVLPAVRLGRVMRIPAEAVEAFIKSGGTKGAAA
jgi:excisionase family DNA binding protein